MSGGINSGAQNIHRFTGNKRSYQQELRPAQVTKFLGKISVPVPLLFWVFTHRHPSRLHPDSRTGEVPHQQI